MSSKTEERTFAKGKALIDGGYENKTVVFGIRPEDIDDSEQAVNASEAVFTSKVNVYELLGAEVFLYFDIAGKAVTARVAPHTKSRPGDEIRVAFDIDKIHVFDKETEIKITD